MQHDHHCVLGNRANQPPLRCLCISIRRTENKEDKWLKSWRVLLLLGRMGFTGMLTLACCVSHSYAIISGILNSATLLPWPNQLFYGKDRGTLSKYSWALDLFRHLSKKRKRVLNFQWLIDKGKFISMPNIQPGLKGHHMKKI